MRKFNRRKAKSGKRKYKIFLYLTLIVIVLLNLFLFRSSKKYWDGKSKLTLAVRGEGGAVQLITFDPESEEIITINIPGNTQVEVSQNLGIWKLGSVWELGESQGYGPELLTKTITRSFKFPVYLLADSPALGFSEGNLGKIVKAVIFPYKTNLRLADKISMGLFSLKIKNPNRVNIDLAKTTYLKSRRLADGEEGFVITEYYPRELLPIFADRNFSQKSYKILIIDASGQGISDNLAQVIEILGAKVASVVKEKEADFGCEVKGREIKALELISLLFACDKSSAPVENFDLEVKIGKEFAQSF